MKSIRILTIVLLCSFSTPAFAGKMCSDYLQKKYVEKIALYVGVPIAGWVTGAISSLDMEQRRYEIQLLRAATSVNGNSNSVKKQNHAIVVLAGFYKKYIERDSAAKLTLAEMMTILDDLNKNGVDNGFCKALDKSRFSLIDALLSDGLVTQEGAPRRYLDFKVWAAIQREEQGETERLAPSFLFSENEFFEVPLIPMIPSAGMSIKNADSKLIQEVKEFNDNPIPFQKKNGPVKSVKEFYEKLIRRYPTARVSLRKMLRYLDREVLAAFNAKGFLLHPAEKFDPEVITKEVREATLERMNDPSQPIEVL